MKDKKFIDDLIAQGISVDGDDFWFEDTDSQTEYWGEEVTLEFIANDMGHDAIWINPDAKKTYIKEEIKVHIGEVETEDGDWVLYRFTDEDDNIIVIIATVD